ncbi:hypothetical protein [Curtobacterium sp. 'Ferrero']|uniref:hypothetical protein n=1 Tax=Curtobacterium sp. 'Ferrero' TaxID=2033654 RepID=UPI001596C451|nr:hypothetical protein [Curtobacterium sp. 'Ferrero']
MNAGSSGSSTSSGASLTTISLAGPIRTVVLVIDPSNATAGTATVSVRRFAPRIAA